MSEVQSSAQKVVIDARHLVKSYGSNTVIRGISMQVQTGEVVAVLGPSGAGKSTFLRMLNNLEHPDSGDVLINGESIVFDRTSTEQKPVRLKERYVADRRCDVAMVFQQFNLYPHLTVLDNVAIAPVKVLGRPRKEVEEEARGYLRSVGLSEKANAYPEHLSGGQQQRVGIARALAMKPKAILFDEPTSALDPETVGEVLQVMTDLAQKGMTMVVVTHELAFARAAASRIVFLDGGVVAEAAPPEVFFTAAQNARAQQFLARML